MTRYLVVGASGQVGSRVAQRLAEGTDDPVRVLLRDRGRLPLVGVPVDRLEVVVGDLRDPGSLPAAVDGVDVVVATANGVVPRAGEDVRSVDADGYRALVDACVAAGVRRFVHASVGCSPVDDQVPGVAAKRRTEERLLASPMAVRVVRLPPFTEVWLALAGSTVVTGGDPTSTVARPFAFLRLFRRLTGRLVDRHGVMLVPGRGGNRNAFVAVDDAAAVLVAAARDDDPGDRVLECGGPQVLTWDDVAGEFGRALGRRVRVVALPAPVYRALQLVLRPLWPPASDIMALNRFVGVAEAPYAPSPEASGYDVPPPTRVAEVLARAVTRPAPR
ncbi:SDR family oxidoreductase [Thalassiella azotivora]